MPKLTKEETKKRADRNRLIVEGWNGGLTGGELATLHNTTRSAILGLLSRARDKGLHVVNRIHSQGPLGRPKLNATPPGRPNQLPDTRRNKPDPGMPPVKLEGHKGNQHTWKGINKDTRAKIETVRKLPVPIALAQKPKLEKPCAPIALLVPFMDLQNNAGCRYSLDAKLFCNASGYPYCPEHKAIVNPPEAQRKVVKRPFIPVYAGEREQ